MEPSIGVLLVNLGTPNSYHPKDVFHYLNEFLTDGRVIDMPWWKRQLLVRGLIVPSRLRQSSHAYRQLWTDNGSPLLIHGQAVAEKLQVALGENYLVRLAMRYQNHSIPKVLAEFKNLPLQKLIILPLFPQYASATTGSVHQKVMEELRHWTVFPKVTFISSYFNHPSVIHAFTEIGKRYHTESFDHVLFSFHGLPEEHIKKSDLKGHCFKSKCCERLTENNHCCYKAQCQATAAALASKLNIPLEKYTISYQSRLGKDPWLEPFTQETLLSCLKKGQSKLLVFCPSFVCDCLETTVEIGMEYAQEFLANGGKQLQLVEGLNSHPAWIEALKTLTLEA